MKQNSLAGWLKIMAAGVAVCGLAVYAWVVPACGRALVDEMPEFTRCYYPWLIVIWITAVPCYAAIVIFWRIASNIGNGRSFSAENAACLKWISILAAADAVFFFIMNVVYLLMNMNHPGIVLLSVVVAFFGIAISVAAAALSRLVLKAAELQEQSDLTV